MKKCKFLQAPHRCHWSIWPVWAAAVWLLIAFGVWFGVLGDLYGSYEQAQQQEQQLRSDYRLYIAQTAQIRADMRENVPKESEKLPEKADIPALLETLQSLAQQHSISLTDIQPQTPQFQGGVYKLLFRLNTGGNFPAFVGFCSDLAARQIEFDMPEIHAADNGVLQMAVEITVRQTAVPLNGSPPVRAASAAENRDAEDKQ